MKVWLVVSWYCGPKFLDQHIGAAHCSEQWPTVYCPAARRGLNENYDCFKCEENLI